MRLAHALSLSTLAAALSGASMFAAAQPTQPRVWDASAPSMPPQHEALPASGTIVVQPGDWKAAHAAVAQFPRGHADVLQWEKTQATAAPAAPAPAAPPAAHGPHVHGGQR